MAADEAVREACEIPEEQQDAAHEEWRPLINAMERGLDSVIADIFA